jgi:MoaA/NifB/PqqE/SkfB family radical SAM enzyme
LLTGMSITVTQEDLEDGSFERMIHLAKELRVNELLVFDTMPIGMYSHREDLKKGRIDRRRLFALVDKYNARKEYPGIFCYAHFRDQAIFGCSAGRNYFYVGPYGDVCPCDWTAKPVGNLREEPLPLLWSRLVEHKLRHDGDYVNACCEIEPHKAEPLVTLGKK